MAKKNKNERKARIRLIRAFDCLILIQFVHDPIHRIGDFCGFLCELRNDLNGFQKSADLFHCHFLFFVNHFHKSLPPFVKEYGLSYFT